MKMDQKIAKANEKEFDLNRMEIKKLYAAARRRNKGMLPELESWFSSYKDGDAFRTVECHFYDGLTGERLPDVVIECCLFDRRMSFIRKTIDEIK